MRLFYTILGGLFLFFISGCHTSPAENIESYFQSDKSITTEVQAAFYNNMQLLNAPISVETVNGVVQLSGYVKTIRQSDTAEAIASKVNGVKQVQNNLIVRK